MSASLYKRMVNCYARANKFAPDYVAQEMEELGDLIADFAPFVGSGGYEEGDLEQLKEMQGHPHIANEQLKKLAGTKVPVNFVNNGLDMVYRMASNSVNKTNDEGDLILVAIAKQCGVIADKVIAA